MTFTNGIPRADWPRFIFDTEHRDAIERQVTERRRALGLAERVVIELR